MYRNREILQKMADDLVCNADKLHRRITETIARLSNFKKDPYKQVSWTKTNLSTWEEFLVLCQSLLEGYSFLSLIRASSVVNRQWTVVPC